MILGPFHLSDVARLLRVPVERVVLLATRPSTGPDAMLDGMPAYTFSQVTVLRRVRHLIMMGLTGDAFDQAAVAHLIAARDAHADHQPAPVVRLVRLPQGADPDRSTAIYREALLADTADDNARAELLYQAAIEADRSNVKAFVGLGNVLARNGRLAEATSVYERATEIDPMAPEPRFNLGVVRLATGELQQAITCLEWAVKLDPVYADAHYRLAFAYEVAGERGAAIPHWRRYIALDPNGPWAEEARRHLPPPPRKRPAR